VPAEASDFCFKLPSVLVFPFDGAGSEELPLFFLLSLDLFECDPTLLPELTASFFASSFLIGSSPSLFFITCSLMVRILGLDLGDSVLLIGSTEEFKGFRSSSLSVVLPFFLSSDDGFFGTSTSAFRCFGAESFVKK
jgi:hypothetical protein